MNWGKRHIIWTLIFVVAILIVAAIILPEVK